MAGLLAAERRPRDLHAVEDVLVADRRADDLAAGRLDRAPAARRSTGSTRRGRPAGHRARAGRGRGCRGPGRHRRPSPSASTAMQPVGVAVEREPDVGAPCATTAAASDAGAVAPQSTLMLMPSGSTWMAVDRRAGGREDARRRRRRPSRWRRRARYAGRCAVDRRAARPTGDARRSASTSSLASTRRPSSALPTPPSSPSRQISCLELVLDRVVELQAVAVEHLEAVVVGRVVRGRDHDPGRVRPAPREKREGRRGHDADDVDVDAEARRAGRDGGHEHVARAARVLADEDAPPGPDQVLRGRPAERVGQGRLEVDVGDATDAVGAEQAGHGVSRRARRGGPGRAGLPAMATPGDRDRDLGPGSRPRASRPAAGRPSPRRRSCPARGRPRRAADERRPGQPVQVGDRSAER